MPENTNERPLANLTMEDFKREFRKMSPQLPEMHAVQTGIKLTDIRKGDVDLKRYACRYLYLKSMVFSGERERTCGGDFRHCDQCDKYDSLISQNELGQVFYREGRVIYDIEKGNNITLEKLLAISYISQEPLHTLISLDNGYGFDEKGCVIKLPQDPANK